MTSTLIFNIHITGLPLPQAPRRLGDRSGDAHGVHQRLGQEWYAQRLLDFRFLLPAGLLDGHAAELC